MKYFLTFCICLEMSLYRNALLLKGKSSMVRSWCITNERMSKSSTFFWLQYLGHRKFSKKTRRDFSSTDANKGQKGTLLTSFFNPCKSHGKSIRNYTYSFDDSYVLQRGKISEHLSELRSL